MKISVSVKLHASEEKVTKKDEKNFVVSINVIPEKGKANAAVIRLLAEFFHVPKSHIHIIRGATSRNKIVEIIE